MQPLASVYVPKLIQNIKNQNVANKRRELASHIFF